MTNDTADNLLYSNKKISPIQCNKMEKQKINDEIKLKAIQLNHVKVIYLLLITAKVEFNFPQSDFDRQSLTICKQTSFKFVKSLFTLHFFSSPNSSKIASSNPLSFATVIDSGIIACVKNVPMKW